MKYTVVENNIAGYINNMGGGGSCTIHVWIGVFVALQEVTHNHAEKCIYLNLHAAEIVDSMVRITNILYSKKLLGSYLHIDKL